MCYCILITLYHNKDINLQTKHCTSKPLNSLNKELCTKHLCFTHFSMYLWIELVNLPKDYICYIYINVEGIQVFEDKPKYCNPNIRALASASCLTPLQLLSEQSTFPVSQLRQISHVLPRARPQLYFHEVQDKVGLEDADSIINPSSLAVSQLYKT